MANENEQESPTLEGCNFTSSDLSILEQCNACASQRLMRLKPDEMHNLNTGSSYLGQQKEKGRWSEDKVGEAQDSSDEESYEGTPQTPDTPRSNNPPALAHHLQNDSSILTLAVGDKHIYAGTQDGEIVVWSLESFERVLRIQAHTRSLLCLFLSPDGSILFSSGGDAIVNAWCPKDLKRLYHIYSTYDVGDVFSVAYSAQFETLYLGAQNTSIQWCSLKDVASRPTPNPVRHPDKRNHLFFDSAAKGGTSTPRPQAPARAGMNQGDTLEIDKAHMRHYAHFGYVYCMLMVKGVSRKVDSEEDTLISGGGDGTIKLWKLSHDIDAEIEEVACLGQDDAESVLSITVDGSFLYSSKLEGVIEVWDLDTQQKLRVIKAHKADIMTLQMGWGYLWSAGATGFARKYSTVQYGKYKSSAEELGQKYRCVNRWRAHEGKILASATTTYGEQQLYITGANDNSISVWDVTGCHTGTYGKPEVQENQLIKSLQEFITFKTISSRPDHAEDCRSGATFLRTLFQKHGAQTEMLNTENNNPVVYARFEGNPETVENRKKILFYGHYDVVPADTKQQKWTTDPFQMKGVNGYLYGRGISDNKGPIMAALYGVVDLVEMGELEADVVFLIEGEEESGSRGFKDAIRKSKDLIGHIDYIILANSYWLDDEVPCLTYGLRGVLHATVRVDSNHPDIHSGVDGSFMMDEPLFDLTSILAKLKGHHNKIQIPHFYDAILPLTPAEEARYDDITTTLIQRNPENGPADSLKASLMARWREPNLTIHRYKVSGPDGSLVSSQASASISLRIVPNQEVADVIQSLTTFLHDAFNNLDTHNRLTITIDNQAEAWLGDSENEIFQTLEEAIIEVWGSIGIPFDSASRRASLTKHHSCRTSTNSPKKKPTPATATSLSSQPQSSSDTYSTSNSPFASEHDVDRTNGHIQEGRKPLYIREGGSIPSIRFLEKELGAPAAHLPCGQASDAAHLDNERLRVKNLLKSKEIFGKVFGRLPRK